MRTRRTVLFFLLIALLLGLLPASASAGQFPSPAEQIAFAVYAQADTSFATPLTQVQSGDTVHISVQFPARLAGRYSESTFLYLAPKAEVEAHDFGGEEDYQGTLYTLDLFDTENFNFFISGETPNILMSLPLHYYDWDNGSNFAIPAGEYYFLLESYHLPDDSQNPWTDEDSGMDTFLSQVTITVNDDNPSTQYRSWSTASLTASSYVCGAENVTYTLRLRPNSDMTLPAGTALTLTATGVDFSGASVSGITNLAAQNGTMEAIDLHFADETYIPADSDTVITISGVKNPAVTGAQAAGLGALVFELGGLSYNVAAKTFFLSSFSVQGGLEINIPSLSVQSISGLNYFLLATPETGQPLQCWSSNKLPGSISITGLKTGSYSKMELYGGFNSSRVLLASYEDTFTPLSSITLEAAPVRYAYITGTEIIDADGEPVPSDIYSTRITSSEGTVYYLPQLLPYGNYTLKLMCTDKSRNYDYLWPQYSYDFTVDDASPQVLRPQPALGTIQPITLSGTVSDTDGTSFRGATVAVHQMINDCGTTTRATVDADNRYTVQAYAGYDANFSVSYPGFIMDIANNSLTAALLTGPQYTHNATMRSNGGLINVLWLEYGLDGDAATRRYIEALKLQLSLSVSTGTTHLVSNTELLSGQELLGSKYKPLYLFSSVNASLLQELSQNEELRKVSLRYTVRHMDSKQEVSGTIDNLPLDKRNQGDATLTLKVPDGVVYDAAASHLALWYDSTGKQIAASKVLSPGTHALVMAPGAYTVCFVPDALRYVSTLWSTLETVPQKWPRYAITIAADKGVDLGTVTLPAIVLDDQHLTKPYSNVNIPATYSKAGEMMSITGHVEVGGLPEAFITEIKVLCSDTNVMNTIPYGIVIDGVLYGHSKEAFGAFHYGAGAVVAPAGAAWPAEGIKAPFDFTFYFSPLDAAIATSFTLSANVAASGKQVTDQLLGSGSTDSIESVSISRMPGYITGETLTLSGTKPAGGQLVIFDGAEPLATIATSDRKWRASVALPQLSAGRQSERYQIRAVWTNGTDVLETEEHTVWRITGGPELTWSGMRFENQDVPAGGAYTWYSSWEPYSIYYEARFNNPDQLDPSYMSDISDTGVVFGVTLLSGRHLILPAKAVGGGVYRSAAQWFNSPPVTIRTYYAPKELPEDVPPVDTSGLPGDGAATQSFISADEFAPTLAEAEQQRQQASGDAPQSVAEMESLINAKLAGSGITYQMRTIANPAQGSGADSGFLTAEQYFATFAAPAPGQAGSCSLVRYLNQDQLDICLAQAADMSRTVIYDGDKIQYVALAYSFGDGEQTQGVSVFALDYTQHSEDDFSGTDGLTWAQYGSLTENGTKPLISELSYLFRTTPDTKLAMHSAGLLSYSAMADEEPGNPGGVAGHDGIVTGVAVDSMGVFTSIVGELDAQIGSYFTAASGAITAASLAKAWDDSNRLADAYKQELRFTTDLLVGTSPCLTKALNYAGENVTADVERQTREYSRSVSKAMSINALTFGMNAAGSYLSFGCGPVGSLASAPINMAFASKNIKHARKVQEEGNVLHRRLDNIMTRYLRDNDDPECMPPAAPDDTEGNGVKLDPSGYIYEAVASNRVAEAIVTLSHWDGNAEVITLPYSEDIDDDNPLISDADGRYAWFVPVGGWRVTAEKNGYESNTSEQDPARENLPRGDGKHYLPVPPPQLDVNIGLTSLLNPTVTAQAVNNNGVAEVYFMFSHYMEVAGIGDALLLYDNGSMLSSGVDYTLTPQNAEVSPAHTPYCGGKTLASIFVARLNAVPANLSVAVTGDAVGYHGLSAIPLEEQTLDIVPMPSAGTLVCTQSARTVAWGTALTLGPALTAGDISIDISGLAAGASVYYTTDGSTPTAQNGTLLRPDGAIFLEHSQTIKLVAVLVGHQDSSILSLSFTVTPRPVVLNVTNPVKPQDPVNPVNPGGSGEKIAPGAGKQTINGVIPYTLQEGVIYAAPSETEIDMLITAAQGNVITLDCTEISGATAIEFEFDPGWFNGRGKSLRFLLPGGTELTVNDAMWGGFVSKAAGGKITILLKIGSALINISQSGRDLAWYDFKQTLLLGIPTATGTVMAGEDGAIIPRSWQHDGKVYAKVYSAGKYDTVAAMPRQFSDTAGQWMNAAITYMSARNVTGGIGNNLFAPNRNVTRGEFITMLMRALCIQADTVGTEPFDDARQDAYYFEALQTAKTLGLVLGIDGSRFAPDAEIARQDMFVMLERAMTMLEMTPAVYSAQWVEYADWADVAAYAAESLQNLSKLGLISGKGDGILDPRGTASRAEAVQVLYNMLLWDAR